MFIKCFFKEENLNLIEDGNFVKYHISLDYLDKLDYNNIIRSDHELERLLYFLVCGNDALLKVYKGDTFMCDVIKKAKQIAGEEELPLYLSNDEITKLNREYHKNEKKKWLLTCIMKKKNESKTKWFILLLIIFYSIISSSLPSLFSLTNTSLGLLPFIGPMIPLSSSKSITLAALL